MTDVKKETSTTKKPVTTESIDQRKIIGQAIIDGILSPRHAAMLDINADYNQNGGNYTQKGGDYRQNGGGNYNQSKEIQNLGSISELISRGLISK